MAAARVRYNSQAGSLVVGEPGHSTEVRDDGSGTFFAHLDDIKAASAVETSNALSRAAADYDSPRQDLTVTDVDYALFDHEHSLAGPISFSCTNGTLGIDIGFLAQDSDEEAATAADIHRTIAPLLARFGWTFVAAGMDRHWAAAPWLLNVHVEPPTRGRTVGDLYDKANEVLQLLEAVAGAGLQRETVVELLRARRAELLIGQPEGEWLDVKRQDYDLSGDAGRISLAQDVARFANAESGGIVVVGMDARKTRGVEVINRVCPVRRDAQGVRRHRQAIDNRLFPPPDGLTVEEVAVEGGRLIVVHVPPQDEELKPFLVHGAIVGDRVQGAFISIVRRRGEASIPVSAAAIHTTLAAGRALLRRGVLPSDPRDS